MTMAYKVIIFLVFIYSLNAERLKLTCGQIRQFVDGHNLRRQNVAMGFIPRQPAGAKINYVVWDAELAAKASKWAENGLFSHNPDRTVRPTRKIYANDRVPNNETLQTAFFVFYHFRGNRVKQAYKFHVRSPYCEWLLTYLGQRYGLNEIFSERWPLIGENIFYSSVFSPFGPAMPNIDEALNTWFAEWMSYNFEPYSLEIGPRVGHYTQMVWADTTKIGCGIAQKRENGFVTSYFVCDYGPTGNWIGKTPYDRQASKGYLICPAGGCLKPYGLQC